MEARKRALIKLLISDRLLPIAVADIDAALSTIDTLQPSITANVKAYADRLDEQAKQLRSDTLVSMAEGIFNDRMADELSKIASELRAMI